MLAVACIQLSFSIINKKFECYQLDICFGDIEIALIWLFLT